MHPAPVPTVDTAPVSERDYAAFLEHKGQLDGATGFQADDLPDFLFGFQQELVEWSVRQGRAAIFADCGLGKTPMQLVWAENIRRHTGRPILVVKGHLPAICSLPDCPNELRLAALMEEVGEVGTAILEDGDIRSELVQVAAVAVAWLEGIG